MKPVARGISQWSWFSEDKQLDFNGLFLQVGEHRILVDPPPLPAIDMTQLRQGGGIDYIVITNRDHLRETASLQKEFGCRVFVPEADAAEMDIAPDKTYVDGELLPGGIWAIHLAHQKSAGECALFIQQEKGILIVGDALIGKPAGSVSLLPPDKYADIDQAREGLRRLLKYQFDTLLVGDGSSILTGAKAVVENVLHP